MLNVKVFKMAPGINEAKRLVRHISCNFKCKHAIEIKNGIMINVNVSVKVLYEQKKLWLES